MHVRLMTALCSTLLLTMSVQAQASRRRTTTTRLLAAVDSVVDVFAGTTTISARGGPSLRIFTTWVAQPVWGCAPNVPCVLQGIEVTTRLRMGKTIDMTKSEELLLGVIGLIPWSWDVLTVADSDTVRYSLSSRDITGDGFSDATRRAFLRGMYTDSTLLAKLLRAAVVRIRTASTVPNTTPVETPGVDIWRRALQAQARQLIDGRGAPRDTAVPRRSDAPTELPPTSNTSRGSAM
jgi:hypothetical protein